VCDLGCGTGRHALRLAAAGARVTALDFSDGMVSRAAGKPGWERVRFIRQDLTKPLPLPDAAYDRVISGLVVDHIPEPTAFFLECGRICRPGGRIVISTVHPAMLRRGVAAHFTDPATGRDVYPESRPHQICDYVMAVVRARLSLDHLSEHAVDDALAARNPRAAKFLHWPLLLLMRMRPAPVGG
jgi:malonyl-CoA O-methyltransferase